MKHMRQVNKGASVKLTKKERLAYIYQLRILEALHPNEANSFAQNRTALEEGFALSYEWLFESLGDELSEEKCREVLDILNMYRAITCGLLKLDESDALRKHGLAKFRGFDGTKESQLMAYVRYYIVDLDRYDELKEGKLPSFNSHMEMLPTYQKMIQRWNLIERKFELSREQIVTVLGAK
jgi:uncharacterized protein YfbU (UPF0304 family)